MKKLAQIYLMSSFLLLIYSHALSQNIFLSGQTENTLYSGNLELINNHFYDLDGDDFFDIHVYLIINYDFGCYYYNYYVEPWNDFKIDVFSFSDTIYPNNSIWSDSSFHFAMEKWCNGLPVDGWMAGGYLYARTIVEADTVYSWLLFGEIGDYFTYSASWCPCYNNIHLGNDTTVYIGDTLILNAGEGFESYLWNIGDTTESITVYTAELGTGNWPFMVYVNEGLCNYADTINIMVFSKTCLPDGVTFSSQNDIDQFQTNYPGCSDIEGPVTINGDDINDLTGLNMVTSITGELTLENNAVLEDISGLENIDPNSISQLNIYYNENLSYCSIENVCYYLANPYPNTDIHDNADGCNHVGEVRDSCATQSIKQIYYEEKLLVFPNPGNSLVTIKTTDEERIENLIIYSQIGQVIVKEKPNNSIININKLPTGLYILEVSTKKWITRKKMVIE